jgi:serine/threonine protein kinase
MHSGADGTPEDTKAAKVSLTLGDVIGGRYQIDGIAGQGGMSAVYTAQHLALQQRVAVKVMLAFDDHDPARVERFMREAQTSARLRTEHVARVFDAGILKNGLPFLVMEFLEGCDLAELLEVQGPLPVQDVADYVMQALDGIAHAHAEGVVHRDLKPSNLFLALRPDRSNIVKVLDFGISKFDAGGGDGVKSLTGKAILGSPAYMSPEQVRSAATVDARTDQWSLGVCMYELLTGAVPFDGEGVGEMLAAILDARPIPVLERRPGVPPEMAAVIQRCLERDRQARFADVGEMALALAPLASEVWRPLTERIVATLAHGPGMRTATPMAFPVAKLVSVIPASTEPAASGAFESAEPPSTRAVAVVETEASASARDAQRRSRSSRWATLGIAAAALSVGVAGTILPQRLWPSHPALPEAAQLRAPPLVTPGPQPPEPRPSPAPLAAPQIASAPPAPRRSPRAPVRVSPARGPKASKRVDKSDVF